MWRGRLKGVQRNVEVWQALLSVRTLVLPMHEDTHTWLKFASLCRKSGRIRSVLLCSYQNKITNQCLILEVHLHLAWLCMPCMRTPTQGSSLPLPQLRQDQVSARSVLLLTE